MIEQPVPNPKISDNVKKNDAIVRDKITVNEAEVKRLGGIIRSSKYEIGELNKQHQAIKEDILNANKEKITAKAEVEKLDGDAKRALITVTELQKTEAELKEKFDAREEKISEKEKQLIQREKFLSENEKAIREAKTEIDAVLESIKKKKEALTEALSKI